jgi:hypothetical protein
VRSREGTTLTWISPEDTGASHLEARKAEGRKEGEKSQAWLLAGGSIPF